MFEMIEERGRRIFPSGLIRAAILVPLLCLFFLLWSAGVSSAAPDGGGPVAISAQLGWDGQVVPGRTAPAVITLRNQGGQEYDGVVEAVNYSGYIPPVTPGPPAGSPPSGPPVYYPVSSYGKKISLPAGAEKKIILWFPLQGYNGKVIFRFRVQDRVLAGTESTIPKTVTGPSPQTVGVLGAAPPALEKVRLSSPDGVPRVPQVIKLMPELIPETGEYLDAFSTILVAGDVAVNLSALQRRALAGWVEAGGRLILAGGTGVSGSLAILPPGAPAIVNRQLTSRNNWQDAAHWLGVSIPGVAAPVAVLSGRGTWWGPERAPVGMEAALWTGRVTVLSFDPDQPPWDGGPAGQALWKKLLAGANPGMGPYGPGSPAFYPGNLAGMVSNLPRDAFPGWRTTGIYLLAFLLLSGPVAYLVLRRRQRPEYTWLAVPALALVFTGAVYLYMLQTGSNVIVNTLEVIDASGPGRPQGYAAAGYFAPTRPEFTATLTGASLPVNVQLLGLRPPAAGPPAAQPPYSLVRGRDLAVHFSDVSQWGMRALSFRIDPGNAIQGLTAGLCPDGSRLVGTVRNGTGLHLEHVTLLLGDDYRVLGDLAPGKETRVDMPVPAPPVYNPRGGGPSPPPDGWRVFQQPGGRGKAGPFRPMPAPAALNVEDFRRASLMNQWFEPFLQGPFRSGWPLTLVAWSKDPLRPLPLAGLRRPPHYLGMIILRPELTLTGGSFRLPEGLVVPVMERSQLRGGVFANKNLYGMESGSAVFTFRPRLPVRARVTGMTLRMPYYPVQVSPGGRGIGPPVVNPAPVAPGVLEVFNPARDRWVELSGRQSFDLTGDYLAGGEVRVRVNGSSPQGGKGFYFLPPVITFRGVMP